MKIVIATAVYYPMINGVAVFSHNLAVGLAARGHEVMVIAPSRTGKSYTRIVDGVKTCYLKSVEAKVYPDQIHTVPEKKKWFGIKLPRIVYKYGFRVSLFPAREVKRLLDGFRPDVVHVQVSDPIGLSVVSYARKHDIPVVTTEHNQPEVITEPLHVPGIIKKPIEALLSAYFVNRQSKSDFVTMPTEKAIRELIYKRKADFGVPVAAVSNGVNLKAFRPGRADTSEYHKYRLDESAVTFLYLGRVDPEKNVGRVIDAYVMMRKKVSDDVKTQLVIVGDGVDKPRLIERAADRTDVYFLGRIVPPELYNIYRLGDVFVTASEIETQGIVLIEAAACGLPLIAVNKGAVSEVCQNDKNGFLCEPGNVMEMAETMRTLAMDATLRERFGKESLKIAGEHDFERTLDKFENIYRKVVKQ